jgi:hypothetical protein
MCEWEQSFRRPLLVVFPRPWGERIFSDFIRKPEKTNPDNPEILSDSYFFSVVTAASSEAGER